MAYFRSPNIKLPVPVSRCELAQMSCPGTQKEAAAMVKGGDPTALLSTGSGFEAAAIQSNKTSAAFLVLNVWREQYLIPQDITLDSFGIAAACSVGWLQAAAWGPLDANLQRSLSCV